MIAYLSGPKTKSKVCGMTELETEQKALENIRSHILKCLAGVRKDHVL